MATTATDASLYTVDPSIEGFSAINSVYLARLSSLIYEERDVVKKEVCEKYGFKDFYWFGASGSNQGFVAAQPSLMIIVFRGTDEADDWWTNLDARSLTTPHGEIHEGFHNALDELWPDTAVPDAGTATGKSKGGMLQTVKALQAGKNAKRPVMIGGHSLGAALASIAAARLALDVPEVEVTRVETIGSPRVFDQNYAAVYDKTLKDKTFRVVNNNDGVPRMPPGLEHVGTEIYINSSGTVGKDTFMAFFRGIWKGLWNWNFMDPLNDHATKLYVEALANIATQETEKAAAAAPKA